MAASKKISLTPLETALAVIFPIVFPALLSLIYSTAWVDKGGIIGRGVLLDYASWATSQNRPSAPLETTEITAQDLNAIAKSQNITFHPGDILFIHTGYISALSSLPESSASSYAKLQDMPAIGVKSNEETLKWLWEKQFAAVAGDMPAFEALPFQSQTHWLHEWLLAGWGLPIGELFDLEPLATECKRLGKWSFWFCSMPLKVCSVMFGVEWGE